MCAERVRENNSFETQDMFCLQTEAAISFPSYQRICGSCVNQDYPLMERPHHKITMQGSAAGCCPSLQYLGISDVNVPYHPVHQKCC